MRGCCDVPHIQHSFTKEGYKIVTNLCDPGSDFRQILLASNLMGAYAICSQLFASLGSLCPGCFVAPLHPRPLWPPSTGPVITAKKRAAGNLDICVSSLTKWSRGHREIKCGLQPVYQPSISRIHDKYPWKVFHQKGFLENVSFLRKNFNRKIKIKNCNIKT